jgi:hypothetical protein
MKKFYTLTTAAGILLALASPTLAAQRSHRAADAYASGAVTDRSGSYYYGPRDAQGRAIAAQPRAITPQFDRGQNAPFADRPYGDPDTW